VYFRARLIRMDCVLRSYVARQRRFRSVIDVFVVAHVYIRMVVDTYSIRYLQCIRTVHKVYTHGSLCDKRRLVKFFTRRAAIKQFFTSHYLFLFFPHTFPLQVVGTSTALQTWLAIRLPHAVLPFRIYCPHTLITI